MTEALEGLKILDLSRYAPGLYCTMILGDLGADIIKIEEVGSKAGSFTGRRGKQMEGTTGIAYPPEFPPSDSVYNPLNRNRRSICLNLKMPEGRDIFYQMTEKADVVVEGFRPGVAKRLGVDYPTLRGINQRIIYCAITGYGQDGPYRDLVGHDLNYISLGGALGMMSHPGAPPPIPGNLLGDMAGGGMQAAIGILAALMARVTTGKGQFVDIAMTDGVVSLLSFYLARYFHYGQLPKEEDMSSTGAKHYYNVYETKDGKFISVACAPEPWFYANLCKALECEEFIPFQTDVEKAGEIRAYFAKKFLTKTRDEWFNILSQTDIAVGKVYGLDELPSDPQMQHRRMIVEINHPVEGKIKQAGISIKLSETPGTVRRVGGTPGEHTEEVLTSLGYTHDDIGRLRERGVIG